MKVSFDYDDTLDRPEILEYAKELKERGFEIWICTMRSKMVYLDIVHTCAVLDIDYKERVICTGMAEKGQFLKDGFVLHLDDNKDNCNEVTKTAGIPCVDTWISNTLWKDHAQEILSKYDHQMNLKRLMNHFENHKGEIVMYPMDKPMRLIGLLESPEDYYYALFNGTDVQFYSAVGKLITLKGNLNDSSYEALLYSAKVSHLDLLTCYQSGITEEESLIRIKTVVDRLTKYVSANDKWCGGR